MLFDIKPVIHNFDREIPAGGLDGIPFQPFEVDWFGEPLDFTAKFRLGTDPERLFFEAQSSLPSKVGNHEKSGKYIEGLWEADVAEIFIREPGSTRYQEWNLSPIGDWWTHTLLDERQRDPDFQIPDKVKTSAEILNNSGWRAVLSFVRPDFDLSLARINVTMILKDSTGTRRFLSCCPNPETEPDFHNIRAYQAPKISFIS
mgnify:CR=1 FL=1